MKEIKIKTEDEKILTIQMKDGVDGLNGKDGKNGLNGKDGKDGKNGLNGKDGKNGKDGRDGLDGKRGDKGDKGEKGKDGKDGKSISEDLLKKFEKKVKETESNLLWVNNGAVRSITAGSGISITGDPQTPTISSSVDLSGYVPYSGLSASNVTANTLSYFNTSKQLASVTLGSGLSLNTGVLTIALSSPQDSITISGSDIDVNTAHFFTWTAGHLYSGDIEQIHTPDSDKGGGINMQNKDGEMRPYLRFSDSTNNYFIGFIAPNFGASQPAFYWTLPEQDSAGVWKSDGAGFMSIAPVTLTGGTDVVGVLPPDYGGTGTTTVFTAGSTIFAGASGTYTEDNANNFWNNTTKRQGYGTNNPLYRLHVSSGDSIASYFTSSAASTRLGVNNTTNTGFGFYIADALKWSFAVVNGGGAGSNPDAVLYNEQTTTNAIWVDGNNNNVSFGEIAPSTTNKFNVVSTYSTSASRIAYFNGASGTSGVDVRTNGQAQYFARSSTHTDRELRFQQFSDGNAYFGTQGLSGAITSDLIIRTGADAGSNAGRVLISPAGTQRITVSGSLGVGIGNGAVTPSAYLTLDAGSATAGTSPLKFTSGTNLTAVEAGAMEWDGSRLYQTQTTGPTRQTIAYLTDITGTNSGVNTGDQNLFQTIAVAGQSDVVADSTTDTLTLVAGTNITITTNATTDTVTINSTGGGGGGGVAGQATVNFGANTQEDSIATVTVNTASALTASVILVSPAGVATADHDPDDYQWDNISGYVTNIVNGVSFDIIGVAPNGSFGQYVFNYVIN